MFLHQNDFIYTKYQSNNDRIHLSIKFKSPPAQFHIKLNVQKCYCVFCGQINIQIKD